MTGSELMKRTSSLRKDWTRGTQRTRKLSTGEALWSWRNGKERFVRARRGTAGAKPYTMKVVRTVFNGGHEETYGNATRLVPTQLGCLHPASGPRRARPRQTPHPENRAQAFDLTDAH